MKAEIIFSPAAHGGGSGWFDFDPEESLDWSFEETVARIHRLAKGQDMFESQEKSSFDAVGFIQHGPDKLTFIICDWREDRRIHVLLGAERPSGLRKIDFMAALRDALMKAEPKEFRSTYVYSENVFSWPPTPTKEKAVKMAHDALNGFLGLDDWSDEDIASKKLVEEARAAVKALEEAFA